MRINPVNYNQTNFKAGKIKIVNPQIWTDAELKAFADNKAFKVLASKLKKQKLDLFIELENNLDSIVFNRTLKLSSGKDGKPQNFIQKIIGPIWQCTPEKRSLIDNIVSYPASLEDLFYKNIMPFEKEKKAIAKELEKYNIIVEEVDYWHFSELKALQANNNFKTLAKKLKLEDSKIHIIREFSDFHDMNYLEFYSQYNSLGTIFSNNNKLGYSGTLTDAITKFESFTSKDPEVIKREALQNIDRYNSLQK